MDSKRPLGSILGRLGGDLGRVGKVSGQVWTRSLKDLEPHNACFLEISSKCFWFLQPPHCSANSLGIAIHGGSVTRPACWIHTD